MPETSWISLIQTLGLPTALLLIILYALYKAMIWASTNLVLPLVNKHIEFLNSVIKGVDKIAEAQQTMAEGQRGMLESQAKITGALSKINERLENPRNSGG